MLVHRVLLDIGRQTFQKTNPVPTHFTFIGSIIVIQRTKLFSVCPHPALPTMLYFTIGKTFIQTDIKVILARFSSTDVLSNASRAYLGVAVRFIFRALRMAWREIPVPYLKSH